MRLRFMDSPSACSLCLVNQYDRRFAVAMDFSFAVARNGAAQERECKGPELHVAAVSPTAGGSAARVSASAAAAG